MRNPCRTWPHEAKCNFRVGSSELFPLLYQSIVRYFGYGAVVLYFGSKGLFVTKHVLLCILLFGLFWPLSFAQTEAEPEARVAAWQTLLDELNGDPTLTDYQKLTAINNFFNSTLDWVSDQEHWGKKDYWATPLETLKTNGGDCEDFSIAKYFSLRMAGVDSDKLRIQYVKALDINQAHMVLTYYPTEDSEPLVLDNLVVTIEKASDRPDLIPIYSFNVDDLWLAQSRKSKPMSGKASALKAWEQTKQRMQDQGQGEFFSH